MNLGIDRLEIFGKKNIEYLFQIVLTGLIVYGYKKWRPCMLNWQILIKTSMILRFFIVLMIITPIIPLFLYNQPYVSTLISQRGIYIWFLLPILARMDIQPNDIIKVLKYITFVVLGLWILSILMPEFFMSDASTFLSNKRFGQTSDIGTKVPGFILCVIFMLYTFNVMLKERNTYYFILSSLLALWTVAYQNRSCLFIIGLAFAYCFIKSSHIRTLKGIIIVIIGLLLFFPFVMDIANSLLDETEMQMNQTDYNRWVALDYFLFDSNQTWYTMFFGHGVVSYEGGEYAKEIERIGTMGGFLADIGIIATFWYYGIIPILLLVYWTYMSFAKRVPLYIKFYSLFFWLVPNQHNFLHPYVSTNLVIVIYVYLLYYHYYSRNTISYEKNIVI